MCMFSLSEQMSLNLTQHTKKNKIIQTSNMKIKHQSSTNHSREKSSKVKHVDLSSMFSSKFSF